MIYGYIRALENCSPERDISLKNQKTILNEFSILNVYIDEISKDVTNNEQLNQLLDTVKPNDIVVITKLSRIAEDLKQLFEICEVFSNKNVILRVIELGEITLENRIITNKQWLSALRMFEEDIKYEKKCKGHLISRKNHEKNNVIPSGSPVKYSKKQLSEALKLREYYTFQEIANLTGISKSTLLRASKKMQI